MDSGDAGYLDLSQPISDEVICLSNWPLRDSNLLWWQNEGMKYWVGYNADSERFMRRNQCTRERPVNNWSCTRVDVPLSDMQRKLGPPIGWEQDSFLSRANVLDVYAYLFLGLTVCLWLAITCHDQALLNVVQKDYIMDLNGMRDTFPTFRSAFKLLFGWKYVVILLRVEGTWRTRMGLRLLALFMIPCLLVWTPLAFLFVVMPFAAFLFLTHPIRMSRFWTFLVCVASMVYGVTLSVHQLYFIISPSSRPRMAVTWRGESVVNPCICGCSFPLSGTICMRLLVLGILATIKSISLGFRCLKGLRRSNWANLMAITFSVPVNAYSVEWTQPDGHPIRFRQEGVPVQGEPAFDPFAMMDEQPESANLQVTLQPEAAIVQTVSSAGSVHLERLSKRSCQGPKELPKALEKGCSLTPVEYVGCCGFPFRTGGFRGTFPTEASNQPDSTKSTVSVAEALVGQPVTVSDEDCKTAEVPAEDVKSEAVNPTEPAGEFGPFARI